MPAYLSGMMWKPLQSLEDLDAAVAASFNQPMVLFKHSTRCAVSSMAKRSFEALWDASSGAESYLVDLLKFRSVSDAIAKQFDVRHESPQMIVVSRGVVQFHASHSAITATHPSIYGE